MTSCAVLSTSASCCVWYPGVDPKAKSSGEAVNGFRVSTSFFLSKVDLSMDLRVARPGVGRGGENATVLPTSLRSIETRRDARRPDREARDRTADGETTAGAIRGTRRQRLVSRETTAGTDKARDERRQTRVKSA